MKLAISGKGGVERARWPEVSLELSRRRQKVLAIDADPDANLAVSIGISPEAAAELIPLSEMKDIVEERTGAKLGAYGQMFKMNPKVR